MVEIDDKTEISFTRNQCASFTAKVTRWEQKKLPKIFEQLLKTFKKFPKTPQFLNNKITTKVSKYLRLLLKKNCGQELTKIAQFGHTVFAANPEI